MRRILLLAMVLIATSIPGGALAQPSISNEIAPLGKLRVAMNGANPALVRRTPDRKIIGGVAVDVGKFIAEKLGVSFELVAYANADAYTQSFGKGEWDIGLGAPIPEAAEKADFVLDLVLTDYVFVAAPGREFADAAQVDRPGVKIGVGRNSAPDHILSRALKSAELVRLSGGGPVEALRGGKADVWAASASGVQRVIDGLPGAKVIPGAFASDRYVVALPKGRSSAAQGKIAEIVREEKNWRRSKGNRTGWTQGRCSGCAGLILAVPQRGLSALVMVPANHRLETDREKRPSAQPWRYVPFDRAPRM